jgi:hypothetical protein
MPAAKKKPKKIYMPCDLGDRKTRREYRKPGPVVIYKKVEAFNEMGEVLALKELLSLPVDQAKEVMLELCRTISDQKLAEAWSTHFTLVRKLRSILGIHKNHSGAIIDVTAIQDDKWPPSFRLTTRRHQAGATEKVVVMQSLGEEQDAAPHRAHPLDGYPTRDTTRQAGGLTLSIRGTYSGAELEPRIEAIRALLSGSGNSRYAIELSLDEIVTARPVAVKIDQESTPVPVAAAGEGAYFEQQAAR